MANDQRVLARVSGEEAREYIRGVNAHVAKHTGKYRWPICGCFACFLLGAVLFGVMMGVFHEEGRLRCEARLCSPGEDPLLLPHGKPCCVFWCCGEGIDGGKHPHELPARPYNTSWDVWSSEAYFGIDERCSLYDEEHKSEDHTKRDANYGCGSCPATLADEKGACKTMFEGNAKDYEVTWPLLFLIPYLLPIPFIIFFICASACAVPRLYEEAFADWRDRGVLICVEIEFQVPHAIDATLPLYLLVVFHTGHHPRDVPARRETLAKLSTALVPGRASNADAAGGHRPGGPARHRHVFGAGTARRAGGPDDAGHESCGRGDAGANSRGHVSRFDIRRRLPGGARPGRRRGGQLRRRRSGGARPAGQGRAGEGVVVLFVYIVTKIKAEPLRRSAPPRATRRGPAAARGARRTASGA